MLPPQPESRIELAARRFDHGRWYESVQDVVVEEPLEVRIDGEPFAVTIRTPGHDSYLAAGLAFAEGAVGEPADILDVTRCAHPSWPDALNVADVITSRGAAARVVPQTTRRFANSGCGACGKLMIDDIVTCVGRVAPLTPVSAEWIVSLPQAMRTSQRVFERTGGLHAAALFEPMGSAIAVFEDIGRHNAVDKLVGWAMLEQKWPIRGKVMMVSGRAGFEILQKAAAAGISCVCSVSAPSSLSCSLAQEAGITLIGFLRGDTFNVYSHPEGIIE